MSRRASVTGGGLADNEAHPVDEATEGAGERLTASVHEASCPDERTDLIINTSVGRGPLPPGDVMSLLSNGTDRRSPVRTPGRQKQASTPRPEGSIEKIAQQFNVFGGERGGRREGSVHLTGPSVTPGHAVSSHSRAGKHCSLIDCGVGGGIQGDDMRMADIAQPDTVRWSRVSAPTHLSREA